MSNLRIKVVKATQIGTVIKPRPKEQQTTVQSRKVNYDIIKAQVLEKSIPMTSDIIFSIILCLDNIWNQKIFLGISAVRYH